MPELKGYREVKSLTKNSGWCFALVNGRLAEIHFDKKFGVWAHSFENKSSYKTKKEKQWIDSDIKKFQLKYSKGFYYDKKRKLKQKATYNDKVFS